METSDVSQATGAINSLVALISTENSEIAQLPQFLLLFHSTKRTPNAKPLSSVENEIFIRAELGSGTAERDLSDAPRRNAISNFNLDLKIIQISLNFPEELF